MGEHRRKSIHKSAKAIFKKAESGKKQAGIILKPVGKQL